MFAKGQIRDFIRNHIFMVLLLSIRVSAAAETPAKVDSPELTDPIHMALPAEIFAVSAVESNIYFDNIVLTLNPANYAFDVKCTKGRQQAERWTWTPLETDVGEFPWELEVRDEKNQIISRGRTTIKVVATKPDRARAISLLLIGDSLTHASIYSQQLLDLSTKTGDAVLKLVGTHGNQTPLGANRHEGYGGWTALRFATHFTETARQGDYKLRGSPFLYKQPDGSLKLDFQQYCTDANEGKFPDVVTIFLGPNDTFSFTDETIAGGIETMLTNYDRLIEMVQSASPSTRVGIMLPVPPAATQDAFGSNYGTGQTRWQYKRNQHLLVETMIKRYRDRQSSGVQLIATHANLDCLHNYPSETVSPNAESEMKIVRLNNGVHPSAPGYRQIGDTIFAWLVSLPYAEAARK